MISCVSKKISCDTVSSSAERGIMCDKILSPDTLNVDMGDFVWNNTASCKCRIWNEVQLISVCYPSLQFWLVPNKIFWSWNWRAPIWWAVCYLYTTHGARASTVWSKLTMCSVVACSSLVLTPAGNIACLVVSWCSSLWVNTTSSLYSDTYRSCSWLRRWEVGQHWTYLHLRNSKSWLVKLKALFYTSKLII